MWISKSSEALYSIHQGERCVVLHAPFCVYKDNKNRVPSKIRCLGKELDLIFQNNLKHLKHTPSSWESCLTHIQWQVKVKLQNKPTFPPRSTTKEISPTTADGSPKSGSPIPNVDSDKIDLHEIWIWLKHWIIQTLSSTVIYRTIHIKHHLYNCAFSFQKRWSSHDFNTL